ncbi:major histocompatibility complex class I UXA2 precursor [Silurus asotus]|uniref:Major histocompatibility complex class I UXA2 n=1 Tax=Silurus asotus TaxID=30991 RepID=A0AAD5ALT8_SILAS|nr:major histocompatibility complex class I UXA2 precursor [Silurus asotus]
MGSGILPENIAEAPTLTRTYTCEISDDHTTRGSLQILYDGEDLIRLNLSSGTWTADNHQAEQFLNAWEHAGDEAERWTGYLNYTCIELLKQCLNYRVKQGSHMLQYHTVVTSRNITTTVELDGETFVSYSSSDAEVILKTEWIKKIDVDVSDYWKSEKSCMSVYHGDLQHHLNRVKELLHQTKGAPTLTRTYTCEISDDNTTRGSLQILYEGENFITLYLRGGTWTADNLQAEQFLKAWKKAGDEAKHWMNYLNYMCIKCLQEYLNYSNSVKQGGGADGGAGGGAGSHTLQYLTVVSSQNATTTGQLDGETFVSYSSSDTGVIPKTEWIKKIDGVVADYWKSEKSRMSGDHGDLQHHLSRVEELLHQTKGAPTLTRTYTCEISDDHTTRGSLQILYDGEDFIRLNLSSGTWTADNHQAEQFLEAWEHAERNAEYWTHYLKSGCIEWLKQYLTYRNGVNQGGGADGGSDGGAGGGANGGSGGGSDGESGQCLLGGGAGSHRLQYLTVVSSLNATTTGQLDGETFVSYSSSDAEVILKTEWIKKIDGDVPDYWKSEKSRMSGDHQDLQHYLSRVEKLLNQTKGAPTLTRNYTCEISDDNTTGGSLQILYDGEDFIRLNLSSGTWTADNHQAEQFLNVWEHAERNAKYWTNYLNHRCNKSLKQYLTYRNSVNQGVSWVEEQMEEQVEEQMEDQVEDHII